ARAKSRIESSRLYMLMATPAPGDLNTSRSITVPSSPTNFIVSVPLPGNLMSVARYWSPKAWRPMMIGLVQPGTRRGTFLQMIGSRKITPPRMLRMVPFGDFHISFRPNSFTRASSGVMVAHLTPTPTFLMALAASIVTWSLVASRYSIPRSKYKSSTSRKGLLSLSLMYCQMIRVISSPSSSTTGLVTLIFAMTEGAFLENRALGGGWDGGVVAIAPGNAGWKAIGGAGMAGFQASRKRRSSQLRALPGGMARITAAALR